MKFKPMIVLYGSVMQPLKKRTESSLLSEWIVAFNWKNMRVLEQNDERCKV